MEAFLHHGNYLDHDSQVGYEWRAASDPAMFQTVLYMTARARGRQITIEHVVPDLTVTRRNEAHIVREAMIEAEQELMRDLARPEGVNTQGVLRHLVQMAKAVAT